MRGRLGAHTALALLLNVLCLAGLGWGQDFQKTYDIPPGGVIRIRNVSGDVKIIGSNETKVVVTAIKEGRDRDLLQIEDRSEGDRIDLQPRYPQVRNCNASVTFEVRVPQATSYNFDRISSVSGKVDVRNVTGQIRAESVSGAVGVTDVSGLVSASSVSGDVSVQITRLQGAGDMRFSSISGDVTVRAPANLDGDVEMSTMSGSLRTDFPIEVQERRYGPGRSARGRLGSGARNLRITTVSGRVSLIRG
jgi:hypothetical protein